MIPEISVKHDLQRLSVNIGLMTKDRSAAAVRALNRTISTVKTESARKLGDEYPGLKIAAIKGRIRLTRADRNNLRAVLRFSNQRLRLFNWRLSRVKTRWGTGVRSSGRLPKRIFAVDAVSGRSREISAAELRSAFIQRSATHGFVNVWLRQGKWSMPIDVLVTPSLSETMVNKQLTAAFGRRGQQRFGVVFAQEAKFRLSKR